MGARCLDNDESEGGWLRAQVGQAVSSKLSQYGFTFWGIWGIQIEVGGGGAKSRPRGSPSCPLKIERFVQINMVFLDYFISDLWGD